MSSWERAPDWVRQGVEPCLHDMQQPSVVDLRLEWSEQDASLVVWEPDGGGTGISLSEAEPGHSLVVYVADQLHEQVFPETQGAWGEERPACPGHQHPAQPTVLDAKAWWVCPQSGQRLSLIGSYSQNAEQWKGRRRAGRGR